MIISSESEDNFCSKDVIDLLNIDDITTHNYYPIYVAHEKKNSFVFESVFLV